MEPEGEKFSEEVKLIQQYTEREIMEYKAIEPEIKLNGDDLMTMDDTEKTVEEMEDVANESSIATFQSKADVMCRGYKGEEVNLVATIKPGLEEDVTTQHNTDVTSQGYKGEEVNVEVQYAGQDGRAELSNNLG